MFFYPSDIFHLLPFGCSLGSPFGSLQQKCDPDRCAKKSHKNRLCFSTHQIFSMFIYFSITWSPNLDPCCKSVILTGAIKIHIKVIYVFYPSDIFHFHSFGCHLGSQLGSLRQKNDPDKRNQNSHKSRLCFFTQQTFPIFISFAVTWCPTLDPCCKNVILTGAIKIHIKVVYAFLPSRHFPFSFLWLSLGVPPWILATKV